MGSGRRKHTLAGFRHFLRQAEERAALAATADKGDDSGQGWIQNEVKGIEKLHQSILVQFVTNT